MNDDKQLSHRTGIIRDHSTLKEISISLLKTKINLQIPVLGPVINEFLFDLHARIKQNRINDFVHTLGEEMKKISTHSLNQEYLRSEEFHDLTSKIFETCQKVNSEEKRKVLARIYINAMYFSETEQQPHSLFIDFVNSLNGQQICLLRFINYEVKALKEIGTFDTYYGLFNASFPNLITDKFEFKYYHNDLELKSLVTTGSGLDNFDSTVTYLTTEGSKHASVELTSLGFKFINYLLT